MAAIPLTGRRLMLGLATLTSALGCGTVHSSAGGDPILGSFERPLQPTPPPTGPGIGGALDSPGVYPAPGVGADVLNPNEFPRATLQYAPAPNDNGYWIPPSAMTNDQSRPFIQGRNSMPNQFQGLPGGAHLVPGGVAPPSSTPGTGAPSGGFAPSGVGSPSGGGSPAPSGGGGGGGSGALAPAPVMLPASAVAPRANPVQPARFDATAVQSVDQARNVLIREGFAMQRLEQVGNGDWKFMISKPTATGPKKYEAVHANQLEAVKVVVGQWSSDPGR